jgi:hypothetical protein
MQIFVGLFRMALGCIFFIIAGTGFNYYYDDTDAEMDRYQKLWNEGRQIRVTFVEQGARSKFSVKGADIVNNRVYFSYVVDGQTYQGDERFKEEEFMTNTYDQLHYMPNDPANYELNLAAKISDREEKNSSTVVFWIALIVGLLGIPIFINGLKEIRYFIRRKFRKKSTDDVRDFSE